MDKNKNRTDLLAAGRKKLQQFRQKKDNKGSKSTTKSGKSERNDNASSTKQAATSQPVREGERSMHDADDAVASSESCSREEDSTVGNNDVSTVVDQPPTSGIAETTAETTVELLSEDSRMGQANLSANVSHELPDHSSSPNEVDNSVVVEDGISTNSKISEIADPKEQSTDSTVGNIDLATVVDQPPTSGIAETTAETTVELLTEDSRMGQANLSANVSHELPDHSSSANQEGDNYVVVEDDISTTSKIPQIAEPKEQSTDSTVGNIDVSTAVDQPPTSGIAETTAETIVDLSSEDSRMGQANLSANVSHELPDHSSSPNHEGDSSVVVEDEISTNSEVPQMADPKEQYTDSAMPLPANISSQVEREYEERQVTAVGALQNAEGSGLMQDDETGESGIEEDRKLTLPESDGPLARSSEIMGQLREEVMSESSKENYSENNSLSADYGCGNSEETRVDIVGKETLVEESFKLNSDVSEKDLGSKMVTLSTGSEMSLITLSQLAEVVRKLDEEELNFLFTSRESPAKHLINADGLRVPVLERLKEQLYLTTFTKDTVYLQLTEQLEIQSDLTRQHDQFVDEMSMATASLNEVRGKNEELAEELAQCRSQLQEVVSVREELHKQLNASRAEVEKSSARVDELQNELEISQGDLSRLSSELIVCRNSLAALQTENENLLRSLHLVTEEKEQVVAEKKYLVLENERLASELAQCKISLVSLQSENVNISKNVELLEGENSKINVENQYFVSQNGKLLAELADCKSMVETLQLENANLNASVSEERKNIDYEKEYLVDESEKVATESINCMVLLETLQMEISSINRILAPVTDARDRLEEEKMYLSSENEKLSHELTDCKASVVGLQTECAKAVDDLKEATLRIEQLVEENVYLKSNLEIHKAKITELDDWRAKSRSDEPGNPVKDLSVPSGVHDASIALKCLKGHIKEAENVMQKLEKAIEGMHSQSASSGKSGGKVVTAGVSKLIQAFESKGPIDDQDSEEQISSGSQSTEDLYELSKAQTVNMKGVLQKLLLDAENATKVVEDERKSTVLANTAVSELNACYGSLKEHSDHLEEANIELMTFSEALRQHIRDVEANEGELVTLYEASQKQEVILKAENSKLAVKLCDIESKISELQSQLDEAYQRSDEMLSSVSNQVEALHEGVASREAALEEEWNSIVTEIVLTVGKLDTSVAAFCSVTDNSLDIRSRVAVSVDAATRMIENLKGQLEASCKDHEAVLNTYNEMDKEFNGLRGRNERAISMLQRTYSDLVRLVKESQGFVEVTETDIIKGKLLDPRDPGIFGTLIEQVEAFLRERSILESENSKLSSELIDRARDIDELNKKCLGSDAILKLLEDVEQDFKLEEMGSKINEPVSRLESLIYYLVQKYKEADEQVNLFREMYTSKKVEVTDFLGQIDHLSFLLIQHENEIAVFKECLKSAEDAIVAVQSELQEKVTELDQSEQRVLSLREKLSIAVTKGKGLIVQRDSLKKSLAETSSDLEKWKQDLQAKDARINELEIKLRAYMEAGERMEALESELSYIRNSATALRESFLLKDSVLQRIEEIFEDLELPEHFHSGDIIEKVDWLAKSVSGNSLPLTDWDQKSSMGGGSYSDAGLVGMDGWKEEMQPNPNTSDDYRRRYEELQSKFYGLAEQNEMLEQSLMERNNLVQRWEEILDRIDVPPQFRSMEPEDRVECLISALSEAQNHCTFLQERIDNLETTSASLTADVEESQRRISELDTAMQSLIMEKETLSKNLEILTHDYDEMSKEASQFEIDSGNLQKEVSSLQEKLDQKHGSEERMQYFEGEIRRFQDLVRGVLQDSGTDDQVYGSDSIEYFEGLLRRLLEKHAVLSLVEPVKLDAADKQVAEKEDPTPNADKTRDLEDAEWEVAVLNKKLDDALGELMYLKEERDRCLETNHSLVHEVEALETKMKELQEQLTEEQNSASVREKLNVALETKIKELQGQLLQEEQKSASIKEKLNVAVRKGKSLVQQRDSMKQLIEETNAEMERLKSVIGDHENAISEYANKMKYLATLQERVEAFESENTFLRDRTAQSERSLQEKEHTLSMILNTLRHIDVGLKTDISDPVEKLEEIGKLCSDLRASLATSQQESSKSKRAAELLLAELNEVQERNDTLQEELAMTATELSELSRERDNYFAEVMQLKSSSDQLRKDLSSLDKLLGDVLSKDLETLRNLEACIKSCLESSDAPNLVTLLARGVPGGIISAESGNKVFMTEIGSLKGQLYRHLDLLDEECSHLADVIRIIHSEMTSKKESFESLKRDIKRLEYVENEKDSELLIMNRNFSLLFEACTSSITEMEKWKAELVAHGFATGAPGVNFDSQTTSFTEKPFSSEEGVRALREKLSSVVKDLICMQAEVFEVNQKDMRSTILNLQKELQEKDIQRERNCMELVGQIKEAEAVAKNYLQELQLAQARVEDLQREVSMMHDERILLEKRTKDLQDQEAALEELKQRIKPLTDSLAAKEQENEALLQALDEEEAQMEDLTNKIGELERVVQQKNQDLENLDISRGKALKKLSVTVSKFDELHNLSESLLSEVEKLQSQLQDRDREISFLRQEVTRCTNDALVASQISNKRNSDEVSEFLTWLDTIISGVQARDLLMDGAKTNQIDEYKEILKEQIMSAISELEDLRVAARNGDRLLQLERAKVEELAQKEQSLESSLRDKESQLAMLRGDSGQATTTSSEIMEVEPMINKWAAPGAVVQQVRSLRKTNNEHVAVAIDVDPISERLEDEDDDKAHGFKSLTTSRIVPRFTRPLTDMIDGLWVSCDRALMRQPALRLGVIIYWALMHALLAAFVV